MTGIKPLKLQHALGQQQLWVLLVSVTWISAFQETRDRTYNVKIGFDLTGGAQGDGSLRIRNFEENEDSDNFKPLLRADLPTSSSASNEDPEKKKDPKVEMKAAEESDGSVESEDSGDSKRSTKGLRADEFEPQGPDARDDLDEGSESADSN